MDTTDLDGEPLPEVMLRAGGPGEEGAHILGHLHTHTKTLCTQPLEMWWLTGGWDRGPRLESGISHNDPDTLQDHNVENLRVERETYPEAQKI